MLTRDDLTARNNIKILGDGKQVMLMAHGFGCDQQMWRFLIPEFREQYTIVLFDYVGSGASDIEAYSKKKYADLKGYAQDIVEIISAFNLQDVILVGHSVSGIISFLAAQLVPEKISSLIMVCPSPCFLNLPPDYYGGFNEEDLSELIDLMDKNYIGWAQYLAPLVTGDTDSDSITEEFTESFCSTNPVTAKNFAKATFFSDYRTLLPHNKHPVLLLQSENDALAPLVVGEYMKTHTPKSVLKIIEAKGHCLHMTHPAEVAVQIKQFLRSDDADVELV